MTFSLLPSHNIDFISWSRMLLCTERLFVSHCQILSLKPNHQADGILRWGLWEVLDHEVGALMNGINALVMEASFIHVRTQRKNTFPAPSWILFRLWICRYLDLRHFLSFQSLIHKFLLLISFQSVAVGYSSPNRLGQVPFTNDLFIYF